MAYVELANRVYNGPSYMDIGAPSGVLWDARLDLLPLSTSANASTLRAALAAMGLTLTRASAATVQTSASTVVTSGIGVDDPRIGNGGYGRGVVIEEARTGIVANSSGSWSTTGTASYSASAVAGPDGNTGSVQSALFPAENDGIWISGSGGVVSSTYTRQAWVKGTVGQTLSIRDASGNAGTAQYVMTGNWQPITITITQTTGGSSIFVRREVGDTATSALVWYRQIELGKFATEAIITTGASATRAADRLVVPASRLIRSGRIGLALRVVPKGSIGGSNLYTSDPYLWRYDASNYASVNLTTGAVTVVVAGGSYTTAAGFTCSANDIVDYWVEAGGGGLQTVVKARKNSGAVTTLGTGSPQGTHPSATSMDLLSNAGSAQFTCWAQQAQTYAPGRRPQWGA